MPTEPWMRWGDNSITRNTLDCDQSNYSSRIVFYHIPIELGQTGIKICRTRKPHIRTKHGVNRTIPPRRYRHLNFPRWRLRRHLGFGETENSAIRCTDLENPILEPNMKWIGRPLAEIWPFEISLIRPKWESRSVAGRWSPVGRSSIYTSSYTDLIYSSSLR